MKRRNPGTVSRAASTSPNAVISLPELVADRLRCRRAASWRKVGGAPWHYPAPGERGYPEAALHLIESGLTPAPNREGLRAMWKAGGYSRQSAEIIARAWELVAT
jgi:hypothetical protein